MARRNPARYLAPVALAATIAGAYLIVHAGLKTNQVATVTSSQQITVPTGPPHAFARAKFYVVRRSDTLSAIAQRTGVSVAELEALNQNIDPSSLQPGQRLRIRR
jgi:LysM repeat protein